MDRKKIIEVLTALDFVLDGVPEYMNCLDKSPLFEGRSPASVVTTLAAELRGEELVGSVELLFDRFADRGYAPALLYDDNGLWAVTDYGEHGVNIPPRDLTLTHFVPATAWKPSIREAVEHYLYVLSQYKEEDGYEHECKTSATAGE